MQEKKTEEQKTYTFRDVAMRAKRKEPTSFTIEG
jgi:hypothetical protein